MFYLEVLLEPTGKVLEVKIHHEGIKEQQVILIISSLNIPVKIWNTDKIQLLFVTDLPGIGSVSVSRWFCRFYHATRRSLFHISVERRQEGQEQGLQCTAIVGDWFGHASAASNFYQRSIQLCTQESTWWVWYFHFFFSSLITWSFTQEYWREEKVAIPWNSRTSFHPTTWWIRKINVARISTPIWS